MGSDSAHDLKLVKLMGILLYSGQTDYTFSSHIRNAQHFNGNRGRIVRCGRLRLCDYSCCSYFMPGLKFKIKLNTFSSLSAFFGLFVLLFSGGLEKFQRNWGSVGHSQRQETCCFYQIQPRRQLCRLLR